MCNTTAKYAYSMELGGLSIVCQFCFKETAELFGSYITGTTSENIGAQISSAEWKHWFDEGGSFDAKAEFANFTACVSDVLLYHNRVIIHGACLGYKGRAWLLCGPSGVGKTTQLRELQSKLPGDVSIICGDRTVLEIGNNDLVMAHPSPWNGKENLHGGQSSALAGIICLERGTNLQLKRLNPKEAILPILNVVISTFKDEEIVHLIASIENKLLENVPVWQCSAKGIGETADMLVLKKEVWE